MGRRSDGKRGEGRRKIAKRAISTDFSTPSLPPPPASLLPPCVNLPFYSSFLIRRPCPAPSSSLSLRYSQLHALILSQALPPHARRYVRNTSLPLSLSPSPPLSLSPSLPLPLSSPNPFLFLSLVCACLCVRHSPALSSPSPSPLVLSLSSPSPSLSLTRACSVSLCPPLCPPLGSVVVFASLSEHPGMSLRFPTPHAPELRTQDPDLTSSLALDPAP